MSKEKFLYSRGNQDVYQRPNGTIRMVARTTVMNKDGELVPRKTRTQAHFAPQCDINNIMKKYRNLDVAIQAVGRGKGTYGDFSQITSYQEALDTVHRANDAFNSLDAQTRKEFDNNPQKLLEFVHDDRNYAKAVKLGLIEKPKGPSNFPNPPKEEPVKAPKKRTTTIVEED